jgi:hypothetical protein
MTDQNRLTPTRRQLLGGLTVAGLATIWQVDESIAQQVVDATGGSVDAAREQVTVRDGLFIGPVALREAVESAPDHLYIGTDRTPPKLHDPGGSLSHNVVASGSSLPAWTAPTDSELAVPPETPAFAVVADAGVRVATGESFATSQSPGDTQMTRAKSIHVAEEIAQLPTPDQTPAIAITNAEGPVVFD